jgi:hypothetical protein
MEQVELFEQRHPEQLITDRNGKARDRRFNKWMAGAENITRFRSRTWALCQEHDIFKRSFR